jgi:hypothetical protein
MLCMHVLCEDRLGKRWCGLGDGSHTITKGHELAWAEGGPQLRKEILFFGREMRFEFYYQGARPLLEADIIRRQMPHLRQQLVDLFMLATPTERFDTTGSDCVTKSGKDDLLFAGLMGGQLADKHMKDES